MATPVIIRVPFGTNRLLNYGVYNCKHYTQVKCRKKAENVHLF